MGNYKIANIRYIISLNRSIMSITSAPFTKGETFFIASDLYVNDNGFHVFDVMVINADGIVEKRTVSPFIFSRKGSAFVPSGPNTKTLVRLRTSGTLIDMLSKLQLPLADAIRTLRNKMIRVSDEFNCCKFSTYYCNYVKYSVYNFDFA